MGPIHEDFVLKILLNRCPPEQKKSLESHLSQERLARFDQMPSPSIELKDTPLIHRIHWSWFFPVLKSYSKSEQKLFLSALPTKIKEPLSQEIGLDASEELKKMTQDFLKQTLIEKVIDPEFPILPVDFLPSSPLNPLLHFTKKKLVSLIDFLSLYALAAELKQIVETKMLKKIYSFLSEEEKKVLKRIPTSPQLYSLRKNRSFKNQGHLSMRLEKWDGSRESFRNLLHKKGMIQLGAALSSQPSDFCWYICHQLDVGRGTFLSKYCTSHVPPEISLGMIRQIREFMK